MRDLLCQICVVSKSVNALFFSTGITSSPWDPEKPGVSQKAGEVEGDHKPNSNFGLYIFIPQSLQIMSEIKMLKRLWKK